MTIHCMRPEMFCLLAVEGKSTSNNFDYQFMLKNNDEKHFCALHPNGVAGFT